MESVRSLSQLRDYAWKNSKHYIIMMGSGMKKGLVLFLEQTLFDLLLCGIYYLLNPFHAQVRDQTAITVIFKVFKFQLVSVFIYFLAQIKNGFFSLGKSPFALHEIFLHTVVKPHSCSLGDIKAGILLSLQNCGGVKIINRIFKGIL